MRAALLIIAGMNLSFKFSCFIIFMPGLWMLKSDNMIRGRNVSCILIGDKSNRRAPGNTDSPFYGDQIICVAVVLLSRKRE